MTPNRDSCFLLDITDEGDGPALHVVTPASVMSVRDADDLRDKLSLFSDPITNHAIKNTTSERRWYVEKILPTLRYYCRRFGVDAPGWLATNGHWERMPSDEKRKLFGPDPLKLREFARVTCPDIAVVRDEGDEQQEQPGG